MKRRKLVVILVSILVYYAQTKGFNGDNLFDAHNLHTRNFRIRGSNKTPAFYTYKSAIEEVRNKTGE